MRSLARFILLPVLLLAPVRPAGAAPARVALRPSVVYMQWLRVAPLHPNILYIGGTYRCPTPDTASSLDQICANWLERSSDGGTGWTSLSTAIGAADPNGVAAPVDDPDAPAFYCSHALGPVLLDRTGQQLVSEVSGACYSASSGYVDLQHSTDGGASWSSVPYDSAIEGGYGAGFSTPAFSPLPPYRLFAVATGSQGSPVVPAMLEGSKWLVGSSPDVTPNASNSGPILSLLPDPKDAAGLYVNLARYGRDDTELPDKVLHSTGTLQTWTQLATPPGVTHFAVLADAASPGGLIAWTTDTGIPADRRWYSADGGATWTAGVCPGDHAGACPRFALAGVFGAGSSYAFHVDGVYAYAGDGPATKKLPVTLPVALSQVTDIAGGSAPGDPVYVLAAGSRLAEAGQLYRSRDAGKSWQRLNPPLLPVSQPSSSAPGSLPVAVTHHAVAPAFVATYRKLGWRTTGYPIDEAYSESGVLTQDFERLRLEQHGAKVVVAPLGSLSLDYGIVPLGRIDNSAAHPIPTTPSQRYFPSTKHSLRGDFLRFWLAHGGQAVLGPPITEPFRAANGDGTGRRYLMQYFKNARVEAHPENRNPLFAFQLGLLGVESARARGWLTAP